MADKLHRVLVAALIQATPKAVEAVMFRCWAKEERGAADLYERLMPGGRERALATAKRLEARATEAEEEMINEAKRAARVAEIVEGWVGNG